MSNYCSTTSSAPYRLGDLGKDAIQSARAQLPVIQLEPYGKRPLKESRGWQKAATVNIHQIAHWWTDNPFCNIGIVLPPGVIVIDLDPRNAAAPISPSMTRLDTLMLRLQELTGELPATRTTRTGSGGRHLFFKVAPAIGGLIGAHCGIAGIDILGASKLVVAPGSIHPRTGAVYKLENDLPVAELPDQAAQALINASTSAATKVTSLARAGRSAAANASDSRVEETNATAPNSEDIIRKRVKAYTKTAAANMSKGNRHDSLLKVASWAKRIGAPADVLDEIVDLWVERGLSAADCRRTIRSAKPHPQGGDQP